MYFFSFLFFILFNFPVAFAPHIAVELIFRFLTGFAGSAFLSVAGGSVSGESATDPDGVGSIPSSRFFISLLFQTCSRMTRSDLRWECTPFRRSL